MARLSSADLCSLCQFACCLWFTHPIITLVTADQDRIPDKIVSLIRALYNNSISRVCVSQCESTWFTFDSEASQWRVLAPESFATGLKLQAISATSSAKSRCENEYLHSSEATSLGLNVNCQKTKVQTLGIRKDEPLTITVLRQEVAVPVVEEFVNLGSLVHSSIQSSADISRCNAITRAAMQNLDNQICKSRISISTKLKQYNTCILPIFLHVMGSYQERCTQDWCSWSMVFAKAVRNQMYGTTMYGMMRWVRQYKLRVLSSKQ